LFSPESRKRLASRTTIITADFNGTIASGGPRGGAGVKKEEISERGKADRASKTKLTPLLSSRSGCATGT